MTTQKSYSSTQKPGMFSGKYFKLIIKRSWTHLLFYAIVFMFVIPVPIMLMVSEEMSYNYTTGVLQRDVIREISTALSYVMMIASAFIGLFAGMTSLSHVNSKVSVNFYHSLPVKREGLFIMETGVKYINYIAAMLLNIFLGFVLMAVRGVSVVEYMQGILGGYFGYSILFFSLIYFITLFAGMIAGTGSFRFLLTLWILAVGICTHSVIIATLNYNSVTFAAGYYFQYDYIKHLSPVIRMVGLLDNVMSASEIFAYIGGTLAFAAVSLVLYVKRKSELSGSTIVYKAVGNVIKYVSMFIVTIAMGLLFESISGASSAGFVFGAIIGAILSFMLLNTILTKNAKAMFNGIKGLGIYGVCFALFFAFVGFDVLGFDAKFPSPSALSAIVIFPQEELTFKNKDDMERIISELGEVKAIDGYYWGYDENYLIDMYGFDDRVDTVIFHQYEYGYETVEVYFKLPLGITLARTYYARSDDYADLYEFITNSDALDEYFAGIDPSAAKNSINVSTKAVNHYGDLTDVHLYAYTYNEPYYGNDSSADQRIKTDDFCRRLAAVALEPFKNGVSSESFNKYMVGSVNVDNKRIPVFSDNTAFFKLLGEGYALGVVGEAVNPYGDVVEKMAETVRVVSIFDTETKAVTEYTDKDQIYEIIENTCDSNHYTYSSVYSYTAYDRRYRIVITTDMGASAMTPAEVMKETDSHSEADVDSEYYNYGNGYDGVETRPAVFRKGTVPAFVGS